MAWIQIVDLGHSAVMVPLAGALAAWMLAGRAWKMALCWCLMFLAGLGVVALSKIAYLGWQAGIPSLDFQALSGHALRATAVLPVCGFLLLHRATGRVRAGGVLLGILAGLGVGVSLVHFRFHTTAEVAGSSVLGLIVSQGFIYLARAMPPPHISRWTAPLSILVLGALAGLNPSAVNHRLVDVALYLSGRDRPYRWTHDRRGPSAPICEPKLAPGHRDGPVPSPGQ